ncbi:hypothetical protein BHM03_00007478 [Ensete ventricosum]|nr:hypothetical protein BHM03_00007478 [Ensete ventricosum]
MEKRPKREDEPEITENGVDILARTNRLRSQTMMSTSRPIPSSEIAKTTPRLTVQMAELVEEATVMNRPYTTNCYPQVLRTSTWFCPVREPDVGINGSRDDPAVSRQAGTRRDARSSASSASSSPVRRVDPHPFWFALFESFDLSLIPDSSVTARELMGAGQGGGGVEALQSFLERRVFPEIGGAPFVVVYMHSLVQRSENFPGVAALRSSYEALPAAVRDGLRAVYFVHPGLQARLFFATFGRFLFSAGLYRKLRYVSRLEFLWEHMRRGEVEVPEFVQDHDEELEHRPLMDYGLVESDHHHRAFDDPAMDSAASMHSLRCIS